MTTLTNEQQTAVDQAVAAIGRNEKFLLDEGVAMADKMVCCAVQPNSIKPFRGNSGASPDCTATLFGFFVVRAWDMICNDCGIDKPETEFCVCKRNKSGKHGTCKKCMKLQRDTYRATNADKLKEYHRAYQLANVKEIKAKQRACYLADAEKRKARQRAYSVTHAEKIKKYYKVYRLANAKKIKNRQRAYVHRNLEKYLAGNRKRKALKLNNHHEPYTDTYIFKRDGWVCGVCGQKINKQLKWPHPRSKTIDHIIALSKGGADAPANLQAAHLRCNMRKSANGGGQLRLMG